MPNVFNWIAILATAHLLCNSAVNAQTEPKRPSETDLIGVWLVTINGESNTRTLIITEAATATTGTFPGAKYGLSGGNLPPVDAKLSRFSDQRQMQITTLASSVIAAIEQPDGTFKGTFTLKGGATKPLLISRVADGSIPQAAAKKDMAAMIALPVGLPADCAALHGNWVGRWSQGGFGEQFLRVVEASYTGGKCLIRFSYSGTNSLVSATITAEATAGSFSFICNRSTSGTCVLKLSGDDLWASYSNPSGAINNSVFRKVKQ